jgi:hypothetical protein
MTTDIYETLAILDTAANLACETHAAAQESVRLCVRASRRCRSRGGRGAARAERRVWAQDRACRRAEAAQSVAMRAAHAAWLATGAAEQD